MAGKSLVAMVKELREQTGAGPKDIKDALVANDHDMEKAAEFLREKGLAKAIKKLGKDRAMNEGLIEFYQHHNGSLGVMVEVNCETDFVAATEQFKTFAKDMALHISMAAPQYITRDDVPEDVIAEVAEGERDAWYSENVLMDQEFVKGDQTIELLLQETVKEVGESIQIARFNRYMLGELASNEEGDEE